MKRIIILALQVVFLAGLASLAVAQTESTSETLTVVSKALSESDIALLRQDVQSMKMDLLSKAMQFTDAEASGFWPAYREYANEQQRMGDAKYQIIKEYAENYDHMSDAKATDLTGRMFEMDKSVYDTRAKYWPRFEKVLGPKRAAKFYQIDRRLTLMIDLELASEIPVLE